MSNKDTTNNDNNELENVGWVITPSYSLYLTLVEWGIVNKNTFSDKLYTSIVKDFFKKLEVTGYMTFISNEDFENMSKEDEEE